MSNVRHDDRYQMEAEPNSVLNVLKNHGREAVNHRKHLLDTSGVEECESVMSEKFEGEDIQEEEEEEIEFDEGFTLEEQLKSDNPHINMKVKEATRRVGDKESPLRSEKQLEQRDEIRERHQKILSSDDDEDDEEEDLNPRRKYNRSRLPVLGTLVGYEDAVEKIREIEGQDVEPGAPSTVDQSLLWEDELELLDTSKAEDDEDDHCAWLSTTKSNNLRMHVKGETFIVTRKQIQEQLNGQSKAGTIGCLQNGDWKNVGKLKFDDANNRFIIELPDGRQNIRYSTRGEKFAFPEWIAKKYLEGDYEYIRADMVYHPYIDLDEEEVEDDIYEYLEETNGGNLRVKVNGETFIIRRDQFDDLLNGGKNVSQLNALQDDTWKEAGKLVHDENDEKVVLIFPDGKEFNTRGQRYEIPDWASEKFLDGQYNFLRAELLCDPEQM